jgi:hypothetical protein
MKLISAVGGQCLKRVWHFPLYILSYSDAIPSLHVVHRISVNEAPCAVLVTAVLSLYCGRNLATRN